MAGFGLEDLGFLNPFYAAIKASQSKSFKEGLFGKDPEMVQTEKFTGGQKELQDLVLSRLQQLLSPETQGELGGAAAQRFEEQTLPSIAQRFTSLGMSPELGGGFGQQVAQARQGMLGQLLERQQSQIPSLLSAGLAPQFETGMMPGKLGFLKTLLQLLGQAGQQAAGQAGSTFAKSLL